MNVKQPTVLNTCLDETLNDESIDKDEQFVEGRTLTVPVSNVLTQRNHKDTVLHLLDLYTKKMEQVKQYTESFDKDNGCLDITLFDTHEGNIGELLFYPKYQRLNGEKMDETCLMTLQFNIKDKSQLKRLLIQLAPLIDEYKVK